MLGGDLDELSDPGNGHCPHFVGERVYDATPEDGHMHWTVTCGYCGLALAGGVDPL